MNIAVIDGQGGGLGKTIISLLNAEISSGITIYALGTNSYAASNMEKAGVFKKIWGYESILNFLSTNDYDCIIGPIGIICPGGIKGDINPILAETIFNLNCAKYLIPIKMHGIYIPGTETYEIKELLENIILEIKKRGLAT